ncbi:MAG: DNA methylase N-4/N-6 protein [uncultured bacterium (gcode 4)]|uniref:DNA methylase N-4/N-6 protein n=1 Tax=uncultured bacterium (gcode 4) TaxID=1234023 RepID=K2GSX8_9BACT|nr:MAG: DNA methylase N-4/N-6 protein [uncultured bacterium (gcode 4)]
MPKMNDIDINGEKWKEYEDIWTDSLWIINERDKSGKHSNMYHGNFVPQIAYQLISRYTKKWEYVLDMFLWSSTTAIECEKLERNIIWVDIKKELTDRANEIIDSKDINKLFITWDSSSDSVKDEISSYLENKKSKWVNLVILHPPYHDIIKFSELKEDLSNMGSVENFLEQFRKVIENWKELLVKWWYLAIIMGDMYRNSEWVPLWFQCMAEAQKTWLKLKSVIVKNMEWNRWKLGSWWIWRYRALSSDYYIFKHEYILIFKK